MNPAEELLQGSKQLGVSLAPDMQEKLMQFLGLLSKWNKVYNLTAIREKNEMVSLHLLDSLAVLPHIWEGKWLDVGCGAGIPGLVFAIAKPNWQFDLLDSNSKKTSFVQQAIIELNLKNVRVHCARAEIWKPADRFDGIITRAFSDITTFIRHTRHLMVQGGQWVAMKGRVNEIAGELPDGCRINQIVSLNVPGLHASRNLVIASCNGIKTT